MRKSQQLQSSNWTSDSSKSKMELDLRNAFARDRKKTKLRRIELNARPFAVNSPESRVKDDTDNSTERVASVDTAKDTERPPKTFDAKKKSDDSMELQEFVSKSMNVVVDIHQEYEEEKFNDGRVEQNEKIVEARSSKAVSKMKTFHDTRNEKLRRNLAKNQRLRKNHDDIEIVDSLNLIEEFQESPFGERNEESFQMKNRSLGKDHYRSFVKEKPRGRKQWDASEDRIEEARKPPRKRWTKDTSIIRLPETKSISWTSSSLETVSPLIRDAEQPLPAVRASKQKSFLGFDNAAFVPETEEIVNIETGQSREDTRIETTNDRTEPSSFHGQSSRESSSERGIPEMIAIAGTSNESKSVSNVPAKRNGSENVRIPEEHSTKSNRGPTNEEASSDKNDSDDTSTVETFSEIAKQSKYYSPEETGTRNQNKKIRRHSKRRSIDENGESSSEEEDDLDDDRSRGTSDENKSKGSDTRRRKSKCMSQHSLQREKKNVRKSRSSSSARISHSLPGEDLRKKRKKKKGVKYISVTIHRADMLEIDYVTKHPMVKVHIVNAETGKFLKSEFGTSTHLQPIITGKFDFKENKSVIPVWEEELVFEHDYEGLLKTNDQQVVILFEIVDLLSFAEASFNYDQFGHEGCWYKIAWAFLKPVGRNNALHVNKKVRLQLYKPQKNWKKFERLRMYDVYTWWKSKTREKYSSSLFVTVTSVDPPKLEPVFYQQLSFNNLSDVRSESQKASTNTLDSINLPKWTRLAAQSCKIPNENIFETDVSENGCFFVAFSNDGKYLACSFSEEHDYPIVIYKFEEKKVHVRLCGHKTFVYTLHWSNNDRYLLSASSDQTARVWDIQNQIVQHIEMMPHPSYVYCGKFDFESSSIVATGCYDRIARIWIRHRKSKNHELGQELEGHEGFVNAMCFQKNSNLLTADSVGIIIIWVVKKNRGTSSRKEWHISRKIKVREIDGVIVNTIILHPLESRLLVHSRNNGLRMLDLTTGVVLQKYNGLNNQRIQLTACISPCGGLILCGNEDSSLTIWNLETGNLLAKYTFDRTFRAVTCVDYHPYDHTLAFCTFGSPAPVRVLRFNKDVTGKDIGLKVVEESETRSHNSGTSIKLLNTPRVLGERFQTNGTRKRLEESLKESSLQSSFKPNLVDPFGNILSNEDNKHGDAKTKLRHLNETEQTLKNRSAHRLYNIIEKIDRILSNTSRSSGDVESGRNFTLDQQKTKPKRIKSLTHLSSENQLNSYEFESSAKGGKHEVLEMKTLRNKNAGDWYVKERSKSARETRNSDVIEDDLSKTFSDSAAISQKRTVYDRIAKNERENIQSGSTVRTKANNSKGTVQDDRFNADHSSSSDSAGTYIVEINKAEGNSNESLLQVFQNDDSNQSQENDSNAVKLSESESSLPSNATFIIENEVPVPKPRKKSNRA